MSYWDDVDSIERECVYRDLEGKPIHQFLDVGYFYAPYIPVTRTVSIDPSQFVARKGLLTRYGRKILEEGAKHYARLTATK